MRSHQTVKGSGEKRTAVLLSTLGMIVDEAGQERGAQSQDAPAAGVVVLDTLPGGTASRAGVATGDVILEVDGAPVTTCGDLNTALWLHDPYLPVRLHCRRQGVLRLLSLKPERSQPVMCWE